VAALAKWEERFSVRETCAKGTAQEALLAYLAGQGAKVKATSDSHIEATTGSQTAIRVKGPALTDNSQYPMRVVASLSTVDEGCQVDVVLSEALGFGVKAGLKEGYFAEFATKQSAITTAIRDASGASATT
jgi:hypothetical protein